ncbi:hypothetical protein EON79_17320 [bacterium]|nr:MAG: hypothetical protein EON79_17320 [bacterium]
MTRNDRLANRPAPGSKELGKVCFALGFLSIAASIAVWAKAKEGDKAHGERFGIFVGLWAPTFFILSDRLSRDPD